jgi:hypothetical protein
MYGSRKADKTWKKAMNISEKTHIKCRSYDKANFKENPY